MKPLLIAALCLASQPALANRCEDLAQEYGRYDTDRLRFEVSGIGDNSALRADNRLNAVQIILTRQAMVLDLMIAADCPLPDPPRPFSSVGVICEGSPQACRQ